MTALAVGVPRHWTFDAPVRLLLLLLAVGLAVAYLLLQRRRSCYEARFSDVDLLASVLPRRPGWRRHLPAAVLLLALVAMTTAFARPRADVKVPRERATVVIAPGCLGFHAGHRRRAQSVDGRQGRGGAFRRFATQDL